MTLFLNWGVQVTKGFCLGPFLYLKIFWYFRILWISITIQVTLEQCFSIFFLYSTSNVISFFWSSCPINWPYILMHCLPYNILGSHKVSYSPQLKKCYPRPLLQEFLSHIEVHQTQSWKRGMEGSTTTNQLYNLSENYFRDTIMKIFNEVRQAVVQVISES